MRLKRAENIIDLEAQKYLPQWYRPRWDCRTFRWRRWSLRRWRGTAWGRPGPCSSRRRGPRPVKQFHKHLAIIKVYVTYVEINSIDSVCLTRPRLPGDEVDEGGGELEGELHYGGDKAALLLGLGAQLSWQVAVDAVADVVWGAAELATELVSGVPRLWQAVTLDEAGAED